MTKKLLIIIAALLFCRTAQAQSYHWSYNYHDYESNFPLIGEVYLDGVVLASSDYEIAAFVGDQVRATEFLFEADPVNYPGHYYAWLGVSYNNTNETVTFKLYNHATSTEYDICSTTVLTSANGYGEIWDPLVIEFTSPVNYGPTYPWTVVGGFEKYMYIEAQVQINGVPVTNTNWEVGAFCGDECRGLGDADNWWVSPVDGSNILEIVVGGVANDVINFYLYDVTNSEIFHGFCFTTLDWVDDDIGDMFNPYIINFVTEQTFTKDIVAYTAGAQDHYYLIASPIGDVNPTQVTNMLDNNFDLYYFDQSEDMEWRNYEASAFDLVSGKGYLYANSNNVTLEFTGYPYSGDGKVTLSKDNNADFAGWNLVGNPFAQTAYINKKCYVMNDSGTELRSVNTNYAIPAMTGLFVIADDDNEILTFSTKPTTKSPNLMIDVSNNGRSADADRAFINFDEGDVLPKFMLNGNNTKLYIPQDGKDYAIINAEGRGRIPLYFKARNNGNYTLCFRPDEVEFSYLHLIDAKTGNEVDLLQSLTYNFDALSTDDASRFRLEFEKSYAGVNENFAFISNGDILINEQGTIQVIDALGRILVSYQNDVRTISTDEMTPGVYVLRLINGRETKTQKIIIK